VVITLPQMRKEDMDTLMAISRRFAAEGNKLRVFDWDRAAQLIRKRKPNKAYAGLGLDWEYTGGLIFSQGEPVKNSYTYLSSNWAIPELDMDNEIIECWKYENETDGWDSDTKWPESALKILRGE
jgi:hypothetical protein